MALIKFTTPTSIATALTGTNLATATASAASGEIDNSVTRASHILLELQCDPAGVINIGETVTVFILPSLDGTNFADTLNLSSQYFATFTIDAAGTQRRYVLSEPLPIPPLKFKFFIYNGTNDTLSSFTLRYRTTTKDVS